MIRTGLSYYLILRHLVLLKLFNHTSLDYFMLSFTFYFSVEIFRCIMVVEAECGISGFNPSPISSLNLCPQGLPASPSPIWAVVAVQQVSSCIPFSCSLISHTMTPIFWFRDLAVVSVVFVSSSSQKRHWFARFRPVWRLTQTANADGRELE